ncbi:MAG: ribonuclease PH [Candidatus Magnetobacterium sp. LHC-1]|uniref:Ribonuclease PH n=1 Tax=Candidatus Magnetobacterium casense TaxID=1455061 RepID=A0ABS6RZG5_9BACT|nr:ribonuclease PH [Candidatus Magnetobacterium casensis]MBF0609214.1 ribonuclease PH [Nitrospirota bacterium]MBV6341966.1 ribonuclease PH [Candidatus Magnetobacterium casensis]
MRPDARKADQLRPVTMRRGFIGHAEGSVLIEMGNTKVICTATIEENVPPFLKDTGRGWITAEYSMLPRSTQSRSTREAKTGKIGGRTHEIQRMIGRALRSVVNMSQMGERTVLIDCDVIQADGGTRTASITGAFVCMVDALRFAEKNGIIRRFPLREYLAATSVGVVDGQLRLDLCYEEDRHADVDMNVVMTASNRYVEIQGCAEGMPFPRQTVNELLDLAASGIMQLIDIQRQVLENEPLPGN